MGAIPTKRRNEIQWLRAIAACEVVVCHTDVVVKHFSVEQLIMNRWYHPLAGVGVELFFVISGYIMCMRAPVIGSFTSFIGSRITRIYPMYWLFTTMVLITAVVIPAWRLGNFTENFATLARSYLILPGWGYPVLQMGWTLEYEMTFYLLVTLVMALGMTRGRQLTTFALVLACLGCIGCAIGPRSEGSALQYHVLTPYMFAFGAGWLFRSIEQAQWPIQASCIALFAAVAAVAVWAGPDWDDRVVFRITFAALVVSVFLIGRKIFQAENALNRGLWLVGDASYSIYLSHWFVLSASGKSLGALVVPPGMDWIARIVSFVLCVVLGIAVFRLIEQPLDRRLHKRAPGVKPQPGCRAVITRMNDDDRTLAETTNCGRAKTAVRVIAP